jgi:hypothetical protein
MNIQHQLIDGDHYIKLKENGKWITTIVLDKNDTKEELAKHLYTVANGLAGKIMNEEDLK